MNQPSMDLQQSQGSPNARAYYDRKLVELKYDHADFWTADSLVRKLVSYDDFDVSMHVGEQEGRCALELCLMHGSATAFRCLAGHGTFLCGQKSENLSLYGSLIFSVAMGNVSIASYLCNHPALKKIFELFFIFCF